MVPELSFFVEHWYYTVAGVGVLTACGVGIPAVIARKRERALEEDLPDDVESDEDAVDGDVAETAFGVQQYVVGEGWRLAPTPPTGAALKGAGAALSPETGGDTGDDDTQETYAVAPRFDATVDAPAWLKSPAAPPAPVLPAWAPRPTSDDDALAAATAAFQTTSAASELATSATDPARDEEEAASDDDTHEDEVTPAAEAADPQLPDSPDLPLNDDLTDVTEPAADENPLAALDSRQDIEDLSEERADEDEPDEDLEAADASEISTPDVAEGDTGAASTLAGPQVRISVLPADRHAAADEQVEPEDPAPASVPVPALADLVIDAPQLDEALTQALAEHPTPDTAPVPAAEPTADTPTRPRTRREIREAERRAAALAAATTVEPAAPTSSSADSRADEAPAQGADPVQDAWAEQAPAVPGWAPVQATEDTAAETEPTVPWLAPAQPALSPFGGEPDAPLETIPSPWEQTASDDALPVSEDTPWPATSDDSGDQQDGDEDEQVDEEPVKLSWWAARKQRKADRRAAREAKVEEQGASATEWLDDEPAAELGTAQPWQQLTSDVDEPQATPWPALTTDPEDGPDDDQTPADEDGVAAQDAGVDAQDVAVDSATQQWPLPASDPETVAEEADSLPDDSDDSEGDGTDEDVTVPAWVPSWPAATPFPPAAPARADEGVIEGDTTERDTTESIDAPAMPPFVAPVADVAPWAAPVPTWSTPEADQDHEEPAALDAADADVAAAGAEQGESDTASGATETAAPWSPFKQTTVDETPVPQLPSWFSAEPPAAPEPAVEADTVDTAPAPAWQVPAFDSTPAPSQAAPTTDEGEADLPALDVPALPAATAVQEEEPDGEIPAGAQWASAPAPVWAPAAAEPVADVAVNEPQAASHALDAAELGATPWDVPLESELSEAAQEAGSQEGEESSTELPTFADTVATETPEPATKSRGWLSWRRTKNAAPAVEAATPEAELDAPVAEADLSVARAHLQAHDAQAAERHREEMSRRESQAAEREERDRERRAEAARRDAERHARTMEAQREAARRQAEKDAQVAAKEAERAARAAKKEAEKAAKRSRRTARRDDGDELRAATTAMLAAATAAAAKPVDLGQAHVELPPMPTLAPVVADPDAREEAASFVIGSSRRSTADLDHVSYDLPEPLPRRLAAPQF